MFLTLMQIMCGIAAEVDPNAVAQLIGEVMRIFLDAKHSGDITVSSLCFPKTLLGGSEAGRPPLPPPRVKPALK